TTPNRRSKEAIEMRNLAAHFAFYAVSRAPVVAELAAAMGLTWSLERPVMSLTTRVLILTIGLLGAFAVHLAATAPTLRTAGGRRSIEDACWQAADRIGDWAGWED